MNYFTHRGVGHKAVSYIGCFEEKLEYFRTHSEFFYIYFTRPENYYQNGESPYKDNIKLFYLGEINFDRC